MREIIIITGILLLSIISGMLGLGVAFSAIPFLSFFYHDLVNRVQPLALLLNGITAIFSAFGFARSGYIKWKEALILSLITTLSAPVGAFLVYFVKPIYVWLIYLASVIFLTYRLFKPVKADTVQKENFILVLILAIPISILSGFLGVGPGFLLMPTLILCGFEPKFAAGINAFAVTFPSFSALIPHLKTASFDIKMLLILLFVGAIGSFAGARVTSKFVKSENLKKIFGVLIVIMTLYKIWTITGKQKKGGVYEKIFYNFFDFNYFILGL
jgi:uncharacterized membrane protein YfcA